ncbi:hypothetical protein NP493_353g06016 [Ridgeia piscesae]|uniref:RRM domain-containing protein n=1 Tax=Ridgeia piscesae TaxID=27915 RepID=A0AAD9L400_RIDPI|nr:hypothetical protein NP493_353g06016 [Ridgeia piscesae]
MAVVMHRGGQHRADSPDMEAEEFDTSAAFYNAAVSKKKRGTGRQAEPQSPARQKTADTGDTEDTMEELDPAVLRSRQHAIRGNEMANSGYYDLAIDLFSKAIKLDPAEFSAFKDGERAIALAPQWPTGYYRKGSALAGLKRFADAEKAFMQVLKLDPNCEDAIQELVRVRTHQLKEMGFSWQHSEQAILQHNNVQQAVDSMLSGMVGDAWMEDVYVSDEEDDTVQVAPPLPQPVGTPRSGGAPRPTPQPVGTVPAPVGTPRTVPAPQPVGTPRTPGVPVVGSPVQTPSWPRQTTALYSKGPAPAPQPQKQTRPTDIKMDPTNPEGLLSVWVGQVMPEVTKKKLVQMFSKYGDVTSVYRVPHRCCAFVNFATKEGAGKAMAALQDSECAGKKLVIRFPDNPTDGQTQTWKTTGGGIKSSAPNPNGVSSLWVGNVKPEVSQDKLHTMFAKYGEVASVRCLPDKFCAFINFKSKQSAEKAMAALQGVECAGKYLLIRFPDNPWS